MRRASPQGGDTERGVGNGDSFASAMDVDDVDGNPDSKLPSNSTCYQRKRSRQSSFENQVQEACIVLTLVALSGSQRNTKYTLQFKSGPQKNHTSSGGEACSSVWWIGAGPLATVDQIQNILSVGPDASASKLHAKLEMKNGEVYLSDHSSKGTIYQTQPFQGLPRLCLTAGAYQKLSPGDEISVGNITFSVRTIQFTPAMDDNGGGKMPPEDSKLPASQSNLLTQKAALINQICTEARAVLCGTGNAKILREIVCDELERQARMPEFALRDDATLQNLILESTLNIMLSSPQKGGVNFDASGEPLGDSQNDEVVCLTSTPPHDESVDPQTPFISKSDSDQAQVLSVFPDCLPSYIEEKLSKNFTVEQIVLELMDQKDYPRNEALIRKKPVEEPPSRNYLDISEAISQAYKDEALELLCYDFRRIEKNSLRKIFLKHNSHYYPTKAAIIKILNSSDTTEKALMKEIKTPRKYTTLRTIANIELMKEVEFAKVHEKQQQEDSDRKKAEEQLIEEATLEGALITCGVCYCEQAFELMVQCADGHLFCRDCLKNWAQEQLFGLGKTSLKCMSQEEACTETFPEDQLKAALPEKVFEKYQEAVAKDVLEKAQLPDLVKCPFCEFLAELAQEDKVFPCPNPACLKESCRLCQRESHIPKRCEEVEKEEMEQEKDKKRTTVEEAMSAARIRECPKCKTRFFKVEGCNKMTCGKCGTLSCYICRQKVDGYQHFCQTFNCDHTKCKKCTLYSNSEEDDIRAMKEAGIEANTKVGGEIEVTNLLEEESAESKKRRLQLEQQQRQMQARGAAVRPAQVVQQQQFVQVPGFGFGPPPLPGLVFGAPQMPLPPGFVFGARPHQVLQPPDMVAGALRPQEFIPLGPYINFHHGGPGQAPHIMHRRRRHRR